MEPPKIALNSNGSGAQASFQINCIYFFNPKSESSFSAIPVQPIDPLANLDSTSWNLTITHHTTAGGENTP